ncbi:MAG: AI-2E family transporter [Barnesiella sp.]|nr:AI-2E family transporter [Barnesiella sp.]
MTERKVYTFDRVVRLIITVAVVAGLIWVVNLLKDVLLPFLVACLIAYLAEPFVQRNREMLHLKGRVVAVFVTLFEGVFMFGVAIYFLAPMVIDEFHQMADIIRRYTSSELSGGIIPMEIHRLLGRVLDFDMISSELSRQEWTTIIENSLKTLWQLVSGGLAILLGVFNWLFVILYVVFIMIDYEKLMKGFRRMVPPAYRRIVFSVGNDVKISMNHYFRGQATIALIVGCLFAIGFLIIGMPMAIVFGLFIGLLNLVPYLQLVSLIPAVALCIVYSAGGDGDFWTIFAKCIAVYCVVQMIQDLYLTPRIMGKAMGLNPAIILLSLSVWGTLLGFIGLIIALPLSTLLLSYYDRYISASTPSNRS